MKTKAAILFEIGKGLRIEEINIPSLKSGQVLIKVYYSGICHTQLLEIDGKRGEDRYIPHCLGHEGSGEVVDVGPDVKKTKPGDKVILSWIKGDGQNVASTQYEWKGQVINSGPIATFNQFSVVSENRITVLPKEKNVDLLSSALIGCAIPTGLGTIFNTAKPRANQSIAVFGCGGIGLWAIQGARIQGCKPIFAIDIHESKLQLAKKLGATVLINAKKTNPLKAIQECGLVDFAVEATGCESVMQTSLQSVKPQGGKTVIVGNASFGTILKIDPREFNMGKSVLGSWGGNSVPDSDYLKFYGLIKEKKLVTEDFIQKTYKLEEINQAMNDLKTGKVIRPILDMTK